MVLDRKEYELVARKANAEGMVLLKNEGNLLPLKEGVSLAVFGRMQNNYYKSGTGSGGMVNAGKVWGILDALKEEKVNLNKPLMEKYAAFEEESPFDKGVGFGNEPWSQKEMPLEDETVKEAAKESDIAIVIIGRTAGEEQDYVNEPGAFKLALAEKDMLKKVRDNFNKVILLMNVSAVLDMEEIEKISPDAIMYVWTGGEMGGLGIADVLMGRVSPSGRLSDSIVRKIEKAPAYPYFGDKDSNNYAEDIYVGYRYYETFDKDAVMYPFGYGLSYTDFDIKVLSFEKADRVRVRISVENKGAFASKEVVQLYVSAPQGKLGKPSLSLCGFAKTDVIEPGKKGEVNIEVDEYTYASYDDTGASGFLSSYVLEEGEYVFYAGKNVRDVVEAGKYELKETKLLEKLSKQLAPVKEFNRMHPERKDEGYVIGWEKVPTSDVSDFDEAMADKPECLEFTGDKGIKLEDVRSGKKSMEEFLAQLSDEDLSAIIRGEGMGSPKVTAGTAAAFGGISKELKNFGIPCGCCSDGPSGMRLDSGKKAFSLPSGTLLACTWNTDLNKELYRYLGMEMTKNGVDVLLGPGINIHRYPLNGRNFEYFSEDPFLTGSMATAQIKGLNAGGTTGTLKHFCGNNQETNRRGVDSVISERALREIYLKGFEMAVKCGANSVMTTYGSLNGIWTCARHDLNTNILRKEWGFKGIVMTDWWTDIGDKENGTTTTDFARMVRAQNDFYAVCPEAAVNSTGDNTLEELSAGNLTRGQLVRCAANICGFLMHTNAMKKLVGEKIDLELLNFEEEDDSFDAGDVTYYDIEPGTVLDFSGINTERGSDFVFGVNVKERACYYIDITGSSELSELAQINVSVFMQGIPGGNFGFRGTKGADMTVRKKILFMNKFGVIRLHFGGSGLDLKNIKFVLEKPLDEMNYDEMSDYIYG
ncbi:MAG TPA: beta-glucosidase [Lachnospiraceae bacterium]|nr:beta-glucosidase [Lachnospiraceae bacterium]